MEVKEQCVVLIRNGAGFACIGNRSSPAWMGPVFGKQGAAVYASDR